MKREREFYILMYDPLANNPHPRLIPTGDFVLTEDAAKAWVEEGKGLFDGLVDEQREYRKVRLLK